MTDRIRALVAGFDRYLAVYDGTVPFSGVQLSAHRAALQARHAAGSAADAARDPEFARVLRGTLLAWGLGVRASRLAEESEFAAALTAAAPLLAVLDGLRIDQQTLPTDLDEQLWRLIDGLGVVANDAKIVAGTKTLHHLLPDLVPPIDREWIGRFFSLHAPEWQGHQQRATFLRLFRAYRDVATQVDLDAELTGQPWRTGLAKLLDNGVIGYCKAELASGTSRPLGQVQQPGRPMPATPTPVLRFTVAGLPPAKNTATSLLSASHEHAPRVRALLAAAEVALTAEPQFTPIEAGRRVALEVRMRLAAGIEGWDATNYLGGIGDVLEDKSCRGVSVDHLGALAGVWLFHNDRQIKQLKWVEDTPTGPESSYVVTVRLLPA
ncbi:hypothetical protein [Kribbella capetownensis]|nr:hypothetical protein [Kribbella capetownensis]